MLVLESAAAFLPWRGNFRTQLAELTRWMHCYYSNLIEGQQTPFGHRSRNETGLRDRAGEAGFAASLLAHLEVQRWASRQAPHSADFILDLHRRFYAHCRKRCASRQLEGGKTPLLRANFATGVEIACMSAHRTNRARAPAHFQRDGRPPVASPKISHIGAPSPARWIHRFACNGRVVRLFSMPSSPTRHRHALARSPFRRNAPSTTNGVQRRSERRSTMRTTAAAPQRGALWILEFTLRTMHQIPS